ncbi:MAG: glycosyltransferase family 4 protein [Actinobacteria bacterium]|nr:glycosyltransferase family 4 protein [Actinomycetota bacterium]
MRLLEITNDFPPTVGGIENYVISLASRWEPDRITVLTRWTEGAKEYDAGLDFEVVREPVGTLLPTRLLLRKTLQLIRDRNIDVVHFSTALPLGLLGPKLLRSLGVPYAVTVNGAEFVLPASLPVGRQMLRRALKNAAVILPYAGYLEGEVKKVFPDRPPIVPVPPGIDPARFLINEQPAFTSPSGGPVILYVGRLVARKGAVTLMKAFERVAERHPGAHLLYVGDGPELKKLLHRSNENGLTDQVTFAGGQPWDEVPAFFASADIFCMPVRERFGGLETEGFGIVFLEAAAAGVPSVAGDAGGARDAVLHDETGLLVDGRSVESVAEALIDLLDDPARAKKMGQRGRERVMNEFTWERFYLRFRKTLEKHTR